MLETNDRASYHVRAAARTLQVIRCFGAETPRLSLSDIARAADLDRATARRLLLTLRDLGYVRQEGRDFSLTPRVLELGYAFLSGLSVVEIARPYLQAVAHRLHETASLTALDGDDVIYLDLASSSRIAAVQIKVGTRFRAHATSMGRVMLADLPADELEAVLDRVEHDERTERTVRSAEELRHEIHKAGEQGWAIVDQELEIGLTGVAAPIRDRSGGVVAAVNVSAHSNRRALDDLAKVYVPEIQQTAAAIAAELLHSSPARTT